MDVETLLGKATDSLTVGRVFGPPIERDGTLIIPVAWVAGGGGGGTAEGNESQPNGSGAGFLRAVVRLRAIRALRAHRRST